MTALDMTDDEARDYLMQHWHLYLTGEMCAAYLRAAKRMEPHIVEVAKSQTAKKLADDLMKVFNEGIGHQTTNPSARPGSEGQGET